MALRMSAEARAHARLLEGRGNVRGEGGQMSVELMAVLPVAIIVAAVAVNALLFLGDCASFDRLARSAIRTYATAPAYGVQEGQMQANIHTALQERVDSGYEQVEVRLERMGGGLTRYTATLDYAPNLFGMGLRDSVLGVRLPHLRHSTSLVVDTYKPGMVFR